MISYFFCNLHNFFYPCGSEACGLLHPEIVQIVLEGKTIFFPKQLPEIGTVDIVFFTETLQREVGGIILFDFFFYHAENAPWKRFFRS